MNCERAQQNIILAHYTELPDELQLPLEQHLAHCEDCRREWNATLALHEQLALTPVAEPDPNLLAASRMRLDDALDAMPARSTAHRFFAHAFRWLGLVQGAPALATLLLGLGFLGGSVLTRYQVAHAPKLPTTLLLKSNPSDGQIASVSGIMQTPNSEIVQVKYNRLVPETAQGSLDDPEIRNLLINGTKLASSGNVQADSVALLAHECMAGHECEEDVDATSGIRSALLTSLRTDRSAAVRLKALQGLQPYVADDEKVRDAVLDLILRDRSEDVRAQAISMLTPVHADTSVREVLRSVSQDANPAVRNASFQVLQSASDVR